MAIGDSKVAKPKQEKRPRAMQVCFKKRKACIMKKTMELSVLCDVAACAVVVDANGEVSTWPENQCEVLKIINRYKDWRCAGNEKKVLPSNDDPLKLDDSLFEELSMESLEELLKDYVGDDDQNLLQEVDSKLHAVLKRIDFLKSAAESIQTPCLLEYACSFEVQSAVESIHTPCFFQYASNEQSILDMVPTPGFSGDIAEQGFLNVGPQFVGDGSEERMLDFVPDPSFFGEVSEQFDPRLNLMNLDNDFFYFGGN